MYWLQSRRTLHAVSAVGPTSLHVEWNDGTAATIDLAPVIARHRDFAFLRGDPQRFAAATPTEKRRSVAWTMPDGTPCALHVDALWRLQHGVPPPLAETAA